MSKRSRRIRHVGRKFSWQLYVIICLTVVGIVSGYLLYKSIPSLISFPASINILTEDAGYGVEVTQTQGQDAHGTGATVTNKNTGSRIHIRTQPGQNLTEAIIIATTAVGGSNNDGDIASVEQQKNACISLGKDWTEAGKCQDKANAVFVPTETIPTTTPSTTGTSCGGAFTTIPAGYWVPTGAAYQGGGRACAYCSGQTLDSSGSQTVDKVGEGHNYEGYATSNGEIITRSCGDLLKEDPRKVIMPPDPGDEYWTDSSGNVGTPPPLSCPSSGGSIPSGNKNGAGDYCFNGNWVNAEQYLSNGQAWCNKYNPVGTTTFNPTSNTCLATQTPTNPTPPIGKPVGTIVSNETECASGHAVSTTSGYDSATGLRDDQIGEVLKCAGAASGEIAPQNTYCQSGYGVVQADGKVQCQSCIDNAPVAGDTSERSYMTCDSNGQAEFHSCPAGQKYQTFSCVPTDDQTPITTNQSNQVVSSNVSPNDPPTPDAVENADGLYYNGRSCGGNSSLCASGYCQKNSWLGIDIFALDKCADNPNLPQAPTALSQISGDKPGTTSGSNDLNLSPLSNPPSLPTNSTTQSDKSTTESTQTPPQPTVPTNALTSVGTGLCQRVGNTYCDGERMYELYEWYSNQEGAWWFGDDDQFTPEEFLSLMIMYESRGGGEGLIDAVTTASSNQLWGTAEGGRAAYCTSQAQCQAGIFNFVGAYMQSAGLRYNNLITTGQAQAVSDGASDLQPYFVDGTVDKIINKTVRNQSPKRIDLNAPTDWGAFDSPVGGDPDIGGLSRAANSGRTGTTDPCGIYFAGSGEVVYSFNQKAAWENGRCN